MMLHALIFSYLIRELLLGLWARTVSHQHMEAKTSWSNSHCLYHKNFKIEFQAVMLHQYTVQMKRRTHQAKVIKIPNKISDKPTSLLEYTSLMANHKIRQTLEHILFHQTRWNLELSSRQGWQRLNSLLATKLNKTDRWSPCIHQG